MSIVFDLWGQRGWARVDVVGESHHAQAIRAVVGDNFKPDGSETNAEVQLLPEPGNRFDRNAVAVNCGRHRLGYLPKEEAARYVGVLSALAANGWTPQVMARIWSAEWSYGEEGTSAGNFRSSVSLDLAEPHLLVPANMPPSQEHRLLPLGAAIQVSGEEKHLDALAPLLRPEGECWAYATLHQIVEETARTSKTLVEVRINGERVGQLTPKMSGDLLPAIVHLADAGVTAAARAIVKGNRIKAEVVLYVARAHELPHAWLNETDNKAKQRPDAPAAGASAPGSPTGAWTPEPVGVAQPVAAVAAAREHGPVPPPPTSIRFVVPPGWPAPPDRWVPPAGWRPDPAWPPAPDGWQWWVPAWD